MDIKIRNPILKDAGYIEKYKGYATFPRLYTIFAQYVGQPELPGQGSLEQLASYSLHIGNIYKENSADTKTNINELTKLNPDIKILNCIGNLVYDAAEGSSVSGAKGSGYYFPEESYLRDIDGNKILGWPQNRYLFDLSTDSSIEDVAKLHLQYYQKNKDVFDGLFIDCCEPSFPWWSHAFDTGINPEMVLKSKEFATRENLDRIWADSKEKILIRIRDLLGKNSIIIGNQAKKELSKYLNGIFLEDKLNYVLQSEPSVATAMFEEKISEYFHWIENALKPSYVVWTVASQIDPGYYLTTGSNRHKEFLNAAYGLEHKMRFGLASTLLGDGYFSYDIHTKSRGSWMWFPEYSIRLGYPEGDFVKYSDGIYSREYIGGFTVVNSTPNPITVEFPVPVMNVKSGKTYLKYTIDAFDACILAKR